MIAISWGKIKPQPKITVRDAFGGPIKKIADEVCRKHGISFHDFISERRTRYLSRIRWEAFWRCTVETTASFPAIGKVLNRDHTTVIYGVNKYKELIRGKNGAA